MGHNSESRKCRRYAVEGLRGNVLNSTDLDILNISIDGAAIETPKRLELNREYTFKIKSQDGIVNIKGYVVWAKLISKEQKGSDTMMPVYRVGIRFTETLSEKAKALADFIEKNNIKVSEDRLGGLRFKIANTENFKLDYPYEYTVKKISLSGMLIETEYSLELNSSHYIELFIHDQQLNIIGRVANCEKMEDSLTARYGIGIEFTTVLYEDQTILKDFLKTLD